MEVNLLTDETAAWDDYVIRHPMACNYHQSRWKTVLEQSFGHPTRYLFAKEGDRIVGILPLVVMKSVLFGRFLVSLPFFNYGGILADDADVEQALLTSAQATAREEKAKYIEFRHITPHRLGLRAKRNKVTMLLDLQRDADSQWDGLDPKVRNQIRKAKKSRLWTETGGVELVDDFYTVFARNMRDLGTPVYSKAFFKAILTSFPASSHLLVVRLERRPVAVGLTSAFRTVLEMPWAASLRDDRHLCGHMLLY